MPDRAILPLAPPDEDDQARIKRVITPVLGTGTAFGYKTVIQLAD